MLKRNYRSRQPIISAAQRLLGHSNWDGDQVEAQVAHRRGGATPVRSVWYPTPEEEADGVATAIAQRINEGAKPREHAVLARSNGEVDVLARALRVRGIPVRTQLPSDFFAQAQVRPLLAYLRVVADPEQTLELYALATSEPYHLGGEEPHAGSGPGQTAPSEPLARPQGSFRWRGSVR